MLSIGKTFWMNPEHIILDEAPEGLAPLIVTEIRCVIDEIRRSGIATLIVDRDWRRVLGCSDHAVVLLQGQVAMAGESARISDDPGLAGQLGV